MGLDHRTQERLTHRGAKRNHSQDEARVSVKAIRGVNQTFRIQRSSNIYPLAPYAAHTKLGHQVLLSLTHADTVVFMDEPRDSRGLSLGIVVCVFGSLGFIITLMPRTDPQLWGAALVLGVLGPIGGIVLASLGGVVLKRATQQPAKSLGVVGIALAIACIISALTLWTA